MAEQLVLTLPVRAATGRGDFFVSEANRLALAALDGWRDWPGGKLALVGPKGAGKSHLAQVWAAESGARVIAAEDLAGAEPPGAAADPGPIAVEDADRLAGHRAGEVALFHLHNFVLAEGGALLLTGRTAPAHWPIGLPDLASRLAATPVARLEPPDDALFAALLVKLLADRGIDAAPPLVRYLATRLERSFDEAQRVVAALDARALALGRPVTRALAREMLAEDGRP